MSEEGLRGLVESGPRNVLAILAALNARSATGALRFEPAQEPDHVLEFLFREGKLLFATSNRPGERLGEYLVRRNVLSTRQATTALLEAKRRSELFHGYLVAHGLLEVKVLQDLLYERAEELLHSILQGGGGRFVFEPVPLKLLDRLGPPVDEELFAHLLTFRNLWPHAYGTLWASRLVLRRATSLEATERLQSLSEVEHRALELVDGSRPVDRLLEGRRDRVELSICLVQFLETGLLEIVAQDRKPRAVSLPVNTTAPAASGRSDAAPRKAAPSHQDPQAQQQEDSGSGSAAIDLEAVPILTSGTMLSQISSAGLTMDDLFVLSQIDGKTSLRQLISITSMGEKPLFRLIHHLVRRGYAELRPSPVPGPPVRSVRKPSRVTATRPDPQPQPQTKGPEAPSQPRKPMVSDAAHTATGAPVSRTPAEPRKPVAPEPPPTPKEAPKSKPVEPKKPSRPEPPPAAKAPPASQPVEPKKPSTPEPPPAAKAPPASQPVEPKKPSAPEPPPTPKVAPKPKPVDPKDEALRIHDLALAEYNAERYSRAEELLRRALSLDAEMPLIRSHLALAMAERQDQMEAAEEMAQEAFEEDPLDGRCLEAVGLLKVRLGDYEKGKHLLERAVLLDRKKSRSSTRIIDALKSEPPGKGQKPEEVWTKLRKHIRLSV